MDPFTAIALISTLVGTGVGVAGSIKAQKASKDARGLQAAQDRIKAQRERTQQVRQMLTRRAEILQSGEEQGASGSSAVAGGVAGAQSAAFGNIQYISGQESFGKAMGKTSQRASEGQGLVTLGQGISAFGQAAGTYGPDIFAPKLKTTGPGTDMFGGQQPDF
jgi:hypothetical protein